MKSVDLPFFVELGSALEEASNIDAKKGLFDAYFGVYRLRSQLDRLLSGEHARLSATSHDLLELRNAIDVFESRHFRDADGKWKSPNDEERSEYEVSAIVSKINQFKTVLIADLRVSTTYTVTNSGIFDVNQLVGSAHKALSEQACKMLSAEVLSEIDASGRCLAFSLPTAAAFHAMRAVERTIKMYLTRFLSIEEIGRLSNWGHT